MDNNDELLKVLTQLKNEENERTIQQKDIVGFSVYLILISLNIKHRESDSALHGAISGIIVSLILGIIGAFSYWYFASKGVQNLIN